MRIAYVTTEPFDRASAAAIRIAGVTSALVAAGHDLTIVASCGDPEFLHAPLNEDLRRHLSSEVDLRLFPARWESVGFKAGLLARGIPNLEDTCAAGNFDVLLAYHPWMSTMRQLRKLKSPSLAVILDLVEWYQLSHFGRATQWPFAAQHEFAMRVSHRGEAMLAISSYLQNYYESRGSRVLRVPPLFSGGIRSQPAPPRFSSSDGLTHVAVAGSIGGKEAMTVRNLLWAAEELNATNQQVRVHIVGPTVTELRAVSGLRPSQLAQAQVYGRVSNSTATEIVEASDFIAVQRPAGKRFAKAGFPSKVVESWVLGTPVISNFTSDLRLYLKEGVNGVVVESSDPAAMRQALARAVRLSEGFDREAISDWASSVFSPSVWARALNGFIENVAEGHKV